MHRHCNISAKMGTAGQTSTYGPRDDDYLSIAILLSLLLSLYVFL